MKVEVEGEYGGSPIRLDMMRLRLAKEVKMKERSIEELTQQQVTSAHSGIFGVQYPKIIEGEI